MEIEISRIELRRKIAELQGWVFRTTLRHREGAAKAFSTQACKPDGRPFSTHYHATEEEGLCYVPEWMPDPTTDMNTAWELARELLEGGYSLSFHKYSGGGYDLVGGAGQSLFTRPQDTEMVCICLAWYEVKTGIRYERLKQEPRDD